MSVIDNSNTRIIDPSFDKSNFRAEFRFPQDSVFQANLRLLNVGISSGVGDSYSPTLGAMGAISSIQLYDGAELLDQIADMNSYTSWKNLNKTNDSNISTSRDLNYTEIGYIQSGVATFADPQLGLDDFKLVAQNPVAGTITNNKVGWVNLQSVLPFLRASMILPTSLYRQLRLVVQYKDAEALKNAVQLDRTTNTLMTKTGTVLVCEEVVEGEVKEQMKKQYQGVVYHPLEFDRVRTKAVDNLADTDDSTKVILQQNNFILHGFNNKKLKRMLVIKKPTQLDTWSDGTVNWGFGNNTSVAQWKEELQIRVNGVNKLAGNGLSGKNRRLAMLTDTWGDVNIISGQQFANTDDFNNYVAGDTTLRKTQGEVDYGGIVVEDYVNTLQVFLERSGVYDNPKLSQALDIIVMGEVEKAVIVNGDRYNVIYTQ